MHDILKVKIAKLGITITGKTPSSTDPEDFGSKYMFVTPSDSFDNKMINSTERYLSDQGVKKLTNKLLPPNSILITCIGSAMGKVSMNKTSCITNQQINSIIPSNNHYPDYIYYAIKNNYKLLRNAATGSTALPLLNKTDFDLLEIPIHTHIPTQRQIATVLSALDAKIELNNRINVELEAMAKTLYDYWFVQFDFPAPAPSGKAGEGLPYKSSGGKMVWSEELKREIPEGWAVGVAADLFNFNPSSSLKSGSIASYIDMDALPTEGFMTKEVQKKQFKGGMKFQNGDLIVSRITPCLENGKTGLITLLDDNEIGFGSTEFIVLRGKMKALSNFAACLSRSELFRKYAIANMTGTSGRKRVEAKALEKFPLVIPEQGILDQFEEIVSPYFRIATIHTKQNQTLTALRDWLLPMLMNGQVRVEAIAEKVLAMAAEPAVEYKKGS